MNGRGAYTQQGLNNVVRNSVSNYRLTQLRTFYRSQAQLRRDGLSGRCRFIEPTVSPLHQTQNHECRHRQLIAQCTVQSLYDALFHLSIF